MDNSLAQHEHDRYLIELLDTTARVVERVSARMDHETREDRETLGKILHELREVRRELEPQPSPPTPTLATQIHFQENL